MSKHGFPWFFAKGLRRPEKRYLVGSCLNQILWVVDEIQLLVIIGLRLCSERGLASFC